jgi:hypothetical protein
MSRYDPENGGAFLPFFAAAIGMLAAGAPLRSLRFQECMLAPNLLPQLRLLTNCTVLHLHELASVPECYSQLGDLLKVCLLCGLQL